MTVLETLYDQTKGQEVSLPCDLCVARTYHKVLASVDFKVGFLGGNGFRHYQIVQCLGCRTASFRELTKVPKFDLPELIIPTDARRKTRRMNVTEELYPKRNIHRRLIKDAMVLPEEVGRIYNETFKALNTNLPVLTGIGIRALLETLCKDRSAAGKNLQEKIDNLVTLGLLTEENAVFLHSLRILGNEAAHEVVPHGGNKLAIAMDIIEHLLTTVYILPWKAKQLQKH